MSETKALVVDDSRAVRMILGRTLNRFGYQVSLAGNGVEGLDVVEQTPDLAFVMVDWNMPVMNGLDFVKRFRSMPERQDVPVVMVTTETEVSQMVVALEAGANEYIMKPFTDDVVADKLRIMGLLP